jgi:hypothetical protein
MKALRRVQLFCMHKTKHDVQQGLLCVWWHILVQLGVVNGERMSWMCRRPIQSCIELTKNLSSWLVWCNGARSEERLDKNTNIKVACQCLHKSSSFTLIAMNILLLPTILVDGQGRYPAVQKATKQCTMHTYGGPHEPQDRPEHVMTCFQEVQDILSAKHVGKPLHRR